MSSAQQSVIRCANCGQQNRVQESSTDGLYKCARCRHKLIVPFKYIVFDTETTGLPSSNFNPHLVQLAWSVHDFEGNVLYERNYIVLPDGFSIPEAATAVHGISDKEARKKGVPLPHVLRHFLLDSDNEGVRLIGHNINFDLGIIRAEIEHLGVSANISNRPIYCTMKNTVGLCKIPKRGNGYKWPKLQELHLHLFGKFFSGGHDAMMDVQATARCFLELRRRGQVTYK